MKIHTVMWHDSGGRIGWPFWEDLQAMSEFMALMGHDVVIYDRDKLARDFHGESEVARGLPNLFDAETPSADPAGLRLSYDCDVSIRYGHTTGKIRWESHSLGRRRV